MSDLVGYCGNVGVELGCNFLNGIDDVVLLLRQFADEGTSMSLDLLAVFAPVPARERSHCHFNSRADSPQLPDTSELAHQQNSLSELLWSNPLGSLVFARKS